MNKKLLDKIKNLPIFPYLDQICENLKKSPSRFLVLTAETAAGKSTAVPLALLDHFKGKILMLEPRRIAAVALANRAAELLDENPGHTAGYTLSLESKISASTRFEVITEAILTRRLQKDPFLDGTNVIIIDEFHERSVHSDLALAFLKETMPLRDDLYVLIMSATINTKKVAEYLSVPPAPVMQIPGRQFPVDIEYDGKSTVSQAVSRIVAVSHQKQQTENGEKLRTDSVLVFLPGIYEITKAKTELESIISPQDAKILVLHSSIPLSEQKKVLLPVPASSPQRIILSSSIAETSLTVPGVTSVIDSGFSRINKMNIALGMEQLVTERESLFNAEQRAGRAGRLMRGHCIRLWNKLDILQKEITPEILRCNLASLVLECAQWGSSKLESFSWLDNPSKSAWNASLELLTELGFIKNSKITQDGKDALRLGIDPRFACAALYGKKTGHIKDALDFILKFSQYKDASPSQQNKYISILNARLEQCLCKPSRESKFSPAELLLSGFPDRLGKKLPPEEQDKIEKSQTIYQFPSGHKAFLNKPYFSSPDWLVAPEVDAGNTTGKIYSYESIDLSQIEEWLENHSATEENISFENKTHSIKKVETTHYGSIILKEKKLNATQEDFGKAVCAEVKKDGLSALPAGKKTTDFILRAQFYAAQKDNSLFEKLENLQKSPEKWLLPFIASNHISEETVHNALYWFLEGDKIDSCVPVSITLENGKKAKVLYETRQASSMLAAGSLISNIRSLNVVPAIEIIIQQIFGCFKTPVILGVPVLLRLLSPARRPLQITDDLEHFWSGAWIEICKEMKGRYPKHNWDYRTVK